MHEDAPFSPPDITDEDIRRTAVLLGLPEDAFHGSDGNDPRATVLKCMDTFDVEACPGSGKTTLLVAKLAILAKKWEYRTRGLCVLSHTNAARREIEKRLGSNPVGQQLLSYPHYIGTIHGFVDTFLALPWLRALDVPVKTVDTESALARRWQSLPYSTKSGLEKNRHNESILQIASPDFTFESIRWGKGSLTKTAQTYLAMQKACRVSIENGCHCYDEMFVWARDLLDKNITTIDVLRKRFPLIFIDEAQDNSELQSSIINRVFTSGEGHVVRQRFGDSNQAIYNFAGAEGASTDLFPCKSVVAIPSSHRFGSAIAELAKPLGIAEYGDGLSGIGPRPICNSSTVGEGPHTIFLFDDDSQQQVLASYAQLLISTYSDEELNRGVFAAVGQVHKANADDKRPRHVGHYWPEYDPELSKTSPQLRTFVQFLQVGQAEAEMQGEAAPVVERIAQGILHLAKLADDTNARTQHKRSHRYVLEMLDGFPDELEDYSELLSRFGEQRQSMDESSWNDHWSNAVRTIAKRVAAGDLSNAEAEAFLDWEGPSDASSLGDAKPPSDNIYRYPPDDPKVHIRIGSVHSIKGQTHTATLVLETFWHKHNLEALQPWLDGRHTGKPSKGVHQPNRLKIHFVAMTRPTHLLCLAMKRSTFEAEDGTLDEITLQALRDQGWTIDQL